MIRSLGLKIVMLVMTMGVVFWINWQPVQPQQDISESIKLPSSTVASLSAETPSPITPARPPASDPTAVIPEGTNRVGVVGRSASRLVDLNSATVSELESLPGIGAVLAQRVIDHRTSVGRFLAVGDLRGVKGIGAKKFELIKSLVTVAGAKGGMEKRAS